MPRNFAKKFPWNLLNLLGQEFARKFHTRRVPPLHSFHLGAKSPRVQRVLILSEDILHPEKHQEIARYFSELGAEIHWFLPLGGAEVMESPDTTIEYAPSTLYYGDPAFFNHKKVLASLGADIAIVADTNPSLALQLLTSHTNAPLRIGFNLEQDISPHINWVLKLKDLPDNTRLHRVLDSFLNK